MELYFFFLSPRSDSLASNASPFFSCIYLIIISFFFFFFAFICFLIFTIRTVQISHAAVCPIKVFPHFIIQDANSVNRTGRKKKKKEKYKRGLIGVYKFETLERSTVGNIDFQFQFWILHLTLAELCTTSSGSGLRLTVALRWEIKTRLF